MDVWLICIMLFSGRCWLSLLFIFFLKQKTAYDMRISDWSSDVCSSDLPGIEERVGAAAVERFGGDRGGIGEGIGAGGDDERGGGVEQHRVAIGAAFSGEQAAQGERVIGGIAAVDRGDRMAWAPGVRGGRAWRPGGASPRYRGRGAGPNQHGEPPPARPDQP